MILGRTQEGVQRALLLRHRGGVEEQVRAAEPALGRRELAVQGPVGRHRLLDPPALGARCHRLQVLAWIALREDREDLVWAPNAAIEVADRRESSVALDVSHELDAHWQELDAARLDGG